MMKNLCNKVWLQPFNLTLNGREVQCANICGFIEGYNRGYTVLYGSHFDTRLIADNEKDEKLRGKPIPGVNDGTSGVAVLLELARVLKNVKPLANIVFVFFDAEDVGNIEGYEFGMGAKFYAKQGEVIPDSVVVLDMVGGKGLCLNIDLNSMISEKANKLYSDIFHIGRRLDYPCFKNNKINMIIGDHYPFVQKNIPAVILIDIDYPEWHTHRDTINACCKESLGYIGDVLFRYMTGV